MFESTYSIAVVMPAHNEAEHVGSVIAGLPEWVDQVFVIDDASTDGTADAARATGDSRVSVVTHDVNRGLGAAMKTGYRLALEGGYDLVAKIDADGQMRTDELARLVRPFSLELADYAKGNRFYFRYASQGMPSQRTLGNTGLSFMTKLASGYWHVYDSQCGYTVVRSAFLRLIHLDDIPDDYFFENAMLIQLNALNARVVDVPISTLYGTEVSGISVMRVLVTFPPRLAGGGFKRFWRKHFVTDFGPIAALSTCGLAFTAFGTAFGAYRWWLSIASGHVASTGTVMIAILPLVLGAQLLLQAFTLSVQSSPGADETAAYVHSLISRGEGVQ